MSAARARRSASLAVALILAAALGTPPVGATSRPAVTGSQPAVSVSEAPEACPTFMRTSAITADMVGTGWTVTTGDTPRAFRVRILGTLLDGIAPGRDLIIIKVSDLPGKHVISQGGGIWSGMSGSPVYLDGQLAGAISYGFSTGTSKVGGMTPARQMKAITAYTSAAARGRESVSLSRSLKAAVARETSRSASEVPTLSRLTVPVVISGASGTIRKQLTTELRRRLGSIKVVTGSATAATSPSLAAPPVAGGNLAVVESVGDITVAAIGTATYVCGDVLLGFGHALYAEGRVSLGAARASSVAIVDSTTGRPFKLVNIGSMFGVVDQDRLSGIRATIGKTPRDIPVTARVRSIETGVTRTGHTSVVDQRLLVLAAASHLVWDIMSATDSDGPGTASLSWTIRGTRPSGQHWSLVRSDRVATTGLVVDSAGWMLLMQLAAIDAVDSEKVHFDSVTMTATVSPVVKAYQVDSVLVSRNGGAWKHRSSIRAHPGDTLRFKVGLKTLHRRFHYGHHRPDGAGQGDGLGFRGHRQRGGRRFAVRVGSGELPEHAGRGARFAPQRTPQ